MFIHSLFNSPLTSAAQPGGEHYLAYLRLSNHPSHLRYDSRGAVLHDDNTLSNQVPRCHHPLFDIKALLKCI